MSEGSDGYKTRVVMRTYVINNEVYVHLGNVLDYVTQHRDGQLSCGELPDSEVVETLNVMLESLWQMREQREQGIVKDIHVDG